MEFFILRKEKNALILLLIFLLLLFLLLRSCHIRCRGLHDRSLRRIHSRGVHGLVSALILLLFLLGRSFGGLGSRRGSFLSLHILCFAFLVLFLFLLGRGLFELGGFLVNLVDGQLHDVDVL